MFSGPLLSDLLFEYMMLTHRSLQTPQLAGSAAHLLHVCFDAGQRLSAQSSAKLHVVSDSCCTLHVSAFFLGGTLAKQAY
jgi:hypothetical protein